MDARAHRHEVDDDTADEARLIAETITIKRDRLLASLTLIAGIGLIIMVPFALRGGAEFFMPVTAALVVAIALVPLLEWFERRGIPSRPAAGLCVLIFLMLAFFAIGSIVIPATDWIAQVPGKIPQVRTTLEPVIRLYKHLDRWIERATSQIALAPVQKTPTVNVEQPHSMLGLLTSSAPHLLIQLFFALLVIFFFLAGWTAMRKKAIVTRGSFEGQFLHADGRRPPAHDQPAVDPHFAILLGLGMGNHGRASGGSSADHHEDHFLRRGNARHRRIPV